MSLGQVAKLSLVKSFLGREEGYHLPLELFFKVSPCSAFSLLNLAKFQLLGSAPSYNANY